MWSLSFELMKDNGMTEIKELAELVVVKNFKIMLHFVFYNNKYIYIYRLSLHVMLGLAVLFSFLPIHFLH